MIFEPALTPLEAENLRVIIAAGVLSFKKGTITIRYDDQGRIRMIENLLISYKV